MLDLEQRRRTWRRVGLLSGGLLLMLLGVTVYAGLRIRATLWRSIPAPEPSAGLPALKEITTQRSIVVAAHPEAVRIGREILAAGGSAIDAAAAVQAALTLVEPESSGLGGGAFLLYYDARSGALKAYDGRETAPAAATPSLFLEGGGRPMPLPAALAGGRSVGVPGVVRLLALAHARHGKLPWSALFESAAALAERGFVVTPLLSALLAFDPVLPTMPTASAYFLGAGGTPLSTGTTLRNALLAQTLRTIAQQGPDAFYTGPIAQDISAAVQGASRPSLARMGWNLLRHELGLPSRGSASVAAGGTLALADLARYQAREREALCVPYRRYRVCGFPPPSAGGIAVLQVLRMLERFALAGPDPSAAQVLHLLAEAERLAAADRDQWVADPDYTAVPTQALLDENYLRERSAHIDPMRALPAVSAGTPPGATAASSAGAAPEVPSTTHFIIVDAEGNIACMTSSIEAGFGSHVMVRGFLLNNQLTDFSMVPQHDGKPVANAVAAGKRPRSSMAPTLVFDAATGKPLLAVGSPGGGRIIGYVLRALIGMLDFGLSPQRAVSLPNVLSFDGSIEIERIGWPSAEARDKVVRELEARGHQVTVRPLASGLHAVKFTEAGLQAGVDPRREGSAVGD